MGHVMKQYMFTFTPVLDNYIDHEWASGLLFYAVLRIGPAALMILKILTALGAMAACIAAGRLRGASRPATLLVWLASLGTIWFGYGTVIRCQVFTFLFFAITLLCLESIWRGRRWPAFVIITCMAAWANMHGGFLAGVGVVGIYAAAGLLLKRQRIPLLATLAAVFGATLLTPYGTGLWACVLPVIKGIPNNSDWGPTPLFAIDPLIGFRILLVASVALLLLARRTEWKRHLPSVAVLAVTAALALRQYRHAVLFGLAAVVALPPFLDIALTRVTAAFPSHRKSQQWLSPATFALMGLAAVFVAWRFLPCASLQVLAPVGTYPVRSVDVLMHANARGKLVTPRHWGGYCLWRLYPRIEVATDNQGGGAYPSSTIDAEWNFYSKFGDNWDCLLKDYEVDYVLFDPKLQARLHPEDLVDYGFEVVWRSQSSVMVARKDLVPGLLRVKDELPEETIQPLDAKIPAAWWASMQ